MAIPHVRRFGRLTTEELYYQIAIGGLVLLGLFVLLIAPTHYPRALPHLRWANLLGVATYLVSWPLSLTWGLRRILVPLVILALVAISLAYRGMRLHTEAALLGYLPLIVLAGSLYGLRLGLLSSLGASVGVSLVLLVDAQDVSFPELVLVPIIFLVTGIGVGWLASTRQRLLVELEEAKTELEDHRRNLEALVARRTLELRQSRERLVRAEHLAELGKFGAGIAHEVRNPLGIISNALYLLRSRLRETPDEVVDRNLDRIDHEVRRANKIISDLMDFARLKQPEVQPVDPSTLVGEAVERLDLPQSVHLELDLDESPTIEADPGQLLQVLVNLATNAIQAMPQGGRLSLRTRAADGGLAISVSDTGPGIEESVRDRLFQPLVSTREGGTGLGLALCKAIVDAHGGRIEADSQPGLGTTFTLILPRTAASRARSVRPSGTTGPPQE